MSLLQLDAIPRLCIRTPYDLKLPKQHAYWSARGSTDPTLP